MKTLSIQNPWPHIIGLGLKDIENRSWATKHRGRIYLHVSGKPWTWDQVSEYLTLERQEVFSKNKFNPNWLRSLPTSAIIGEVDIVDCVINHPSVWADKIATYTCPDSGIEIIQRGQKPIYNWVLANPVLYDKPILNVKGKLSLWEFEKEVTNV